MKTSGVYKWSFRVQLINTSYHVFCGIALASHPINGSDYLGNTSSTWGFSTGNGATYHDGVMDVSNSSSLSEKRNLFDDDTTITIVLTLSDDGLNNRLEASVGSKKMVQLFEGGDLVSDESLPSSVQS